MLAYLEYSLGEFLGLTAARVKALVERRHGAYLVQAQAACPQGERVLRARPSRSRTVETLLGAVTLERPYFYCVGCAHRFYPLDEALGLSGPTKQWDVQHAGTQLALETGADLISADRHFEYVDGIAWIRVAAESATGGRSPCSTNSLELCWALQSPRVRTMRPCGSTT